MATPVAEVVKVNWKQIFPWLALFRTLGLALHLRQVLVGTVAAALMALVGGLLSNRPVNVRTDWGSALGVLSSGVWRPMVDLTAPIIGPESPRLVGAASQTWWELALLVIEIALAFVIGGLAGGILVRRAASEFCREESLSLRDAVRFVIRRGLDYVSAPALPMAGVFGLVFLLMFAGWVSRVIPGGNYLASALWGVIVIIGLGSALLLILTIAAWPMMIAAVSINGGDGFDALSRGFGFVIDRWRYYAWCAAVMTLYGTMCTVLLLAMQLIGEGLLSAHVTRQFIPMDLPQLLPDGWWQMLLSLIARGLGYSFFWSSMTVTYLVLRKSVDNAELQDMYVEGGPQEPDDLQALLNPQLAPGPTLLPIIDPPQA